MYLGNLILIIFDLTVGYKRARSWLKAILTSTAEKIAKGTALESLDCYSGTLYAYIYDESMPRIFKNVELVSCTLFCCCCFLLSSPSWLVWIRCTL